MRLTQIYISMVCARRTLHCGTSTTTTRSHRFCSCTTSSRARIQLYFTWSLNRNRIWWKYNIKEKNNNNAKMSAFTSASINLRVVKQIAGNCKVNYVACFKKFILYFTCERDLSAAPRRSLSRCVSAALRTIVIFLFPPRYIFFTDWYVHIKQRYTIDISHFVFVTKLYTHGKCNNALAHAAAARRHIQCFCALWWARPRHARPRIEKQWHTKWADGGGVFKCLQLQFYFILSKHIYVFNMVH